MAFYVGMLCNHKIPQNAREKLEIMVLYIFSIGFEGVI